MYERGNGVKVNMEKAAELYMWAAERGYASAQFNLGTFSATTTPHHSPPLHPYNQGHYWRPIIRIFSGVFYENGRGLHQDYDKALHYYREAADQDHKIANYNLGVFYERGKGVEQNYSKAIQFYQKAADMDYANAQYNLGVLYDTGKKSYLYFWFLFVLQKN